MLNTTRFFGSISADLKIPFNWLRFSNFKIFIVSTHFSREALESGYFLIKSTRTFSDMILTKESYTFWKQISIFFNQLTKPKKIPDKIEDFPNSLN
mgnify:CR=1 FL=1